MRARRFSERVSACLSGAALSETIAVAVHFENADVVGNAVEQCTSQTLGADDVMMPFSLIVYCVALGFEDRRFACRTGQFARAAPWSAVCLG